MAVAVAQDGRAAPRARADRTGQAGVLNADRHRASRVVDLLNADDDFRSLDDCRRLFSRPQPELLRCLVRDRCGHYCRIAYLDLDDRCYSAFVDLGDDALKLVPGTQLHTVSQ